MAEAARHVDSLVSWQVLCRYEPQLSIDIQRAVPGFPTFQPGAEHSIRQQPSQHPSQRK